MSEGIDKVPAEISEPAKIAAEMIMEVVDGMLTEAGYVAEDGHGSSNSAVANIVQYAINLSRPMQMEDPEILRRMKMLQDLRLTSPLIRRVYSLVLGGGWPEEIVWLTIATELIQIKLTRDGGAAERRGLRSDQRIAGLLV